MLEFKEVKLPSAKVVRNTIFEVVAGNRAIFLAMSYLRLGSSFELPLLYFNNAYY